MEPLAATGKICCQKQKWPVTGAGRSLELAGHWIIALISAVPVFSEIPHVFSFFGDGEILTTRLVVAEK